MKASVLSSRCEIRYDIPTIVIAECVLVYMEPDRSEELLKWVANAFREGCCALYEQIRPDDPFGRQMVEKLRSHGRALRGISATPSLKAQARRLARVGWERAGAMDMLQAYNSLLTAEVRFPYSHSCCTHLPGYQNFPCVRGRGFSKTFSLIHRIGSKES